MIVNSKMNMYNWGCRQNSGPKFIGGFIIYYKEERKKAVDLYVQYDKQLSKTIKTLGYPLSRHTLRKWYYDFNDCMNSKTSLLENQSILKNKKKKL